MIYPIFSPDIFPAFLVLAFLSLGLICILNAVFLSVLEKPNSKIFLFIGALILLWSTCIGDYSQITPADISDLLRITTRSTD